MKKKYWKTYLGFSYEQAQRGWYARIDPISDIVSWKYGFISPHLTFLHQLKWFFKVKPSRLNKQLNFHLKCILYIHFWPISDLLYIRLFLIDDWIWWSSVLDRLKQCFPNFTPILRILRNSRCRLRILKKFNGNLVNVTVSKSLKSKR